MGLILNTSTIIRNLSIGPLSGGGGEGGGGGGSLVTSGLVYHYDIGSTFSYPGSGNTISDLSGNSQDATITTSGNPNFDYVSAGTSSYIRVISDTSIGNNNVGNTYDIAGQPFDLTLSVWFRIEGTAGGTWPSTYLYESQGLEYLMHHTSHGTPSERGKLKVFTKGQTTVSHLLPEVLMPDGTATTDWFNVTTTGVNNVITHYINGVSQVSFTHTNVDNGAEGRVKLPSANRAHFAHGTYYNRGLSASEVLGNFNALKSRYGY